jgi:hypothetical protein
MRTFTKTILLSALTTVGSSVALHAQETAQQIVQKSRDAMTIAGFESVNTLTIKDDKGNQRIRKFSAATKSDPSQKVTKTVMRFLEPADVKGTGFLSFEYDNKENEMWLYMPALRKVRRIVSSEKSKSFMGSEFSNADIEKPKIDGFSFNNLGTATVNSVDCWKIEAVPATASSASEYGYSKKIMLIAKTDFIARKVDYFDKTGKVFKIMKTENVKLIDEKGNKYQPMDITMENIQNGRSSRFEIEKIVFNPNVKSEYFSTDYLEK